MNNQTDEVKSKIDIVEFIGQRVSLKKIGRNFKGLCPFHNEKTPSFIVSPERQIWHCFGTCGTGGDVISFEMRWDNLTFYEALKELAQQAGVVLKTDEFTDSKWRHNELLIEINQRASKFYQYLLHTEKYGKNAMKYLLSRGINDKIISTFEIGYAPSSWDSLHTYLLKKGYTRQDIAATGLEIVQNGNRVYDRFRNRIVFPLKDVRGNVVGFSGRLFNDAEKTAKYVNTPETELYHKRDHVFGIHLTKDAIRKSDLAIIVEGEFDLVSPYQNGIENIVAIKGSALTEGQLNILKRFTKRIALALDMDDAGIEAMKRGIEIAEKMDFEIHIVEFSKGKDPDEAVRVDKVQFSRDVAHSRPIYDFLIDTAKRKYPENSPFHKKRIAEEVAPFIRLIQNPIVKSHYVRLLAKLLGVEESSVERLLQKVGYAQKIHFKKQESKSKQLMPREEATQRYILCYLLQHKNPQKVFETLTDVSDTDVFTVPIYKELYQSLKKYSKAITTDFEYTHFVKILNPQAQSVADELFMLAGEIPDLKEIDFQKLMYGLKATRLKADIQKIIGNESKEDDENLSQLASQLKDVEKILRT